MAARAQLVRLAVWRALLRRGLMPTLRRARHEAWVRLGGPSRVLPDHAAPSGPFLPASLPPPALDAPMLARVLTGADAAARTPDWSTDRPDATAPWHAIDPYAHGDIRLLWQTSRFAALPALALAARTSGSRRFLAAAEAHITSFLTACPPFQGPHWASAQEAAIRLIHVVGAGLILGGPPTSGTRRLATLLASRVRATLLYERSLANNHGLVCAAALAGAGAWLGTEDRRVGERVLAADLPRLTTKAGGFAQISTRYHRMTLDALSFAVLAGASLAPTDVARARAMTTWLARVTDPATGRTPRLGHDDGTVLLDAAGAGADDTRPSLARAAAAFGTCSAEPALALAGLGQLPDPPSGVWTDPDGGTAGITAGQTIALLRLPGGRFPAGQGDILHLALMHRGEEILRDAGTWLYNPPPGETDLAGTAHHNTAQWGAVDRPPRLGRFLFAAPPRLRGLDRSPLGLRAACDGHDRTVAVEGNTVVVTDRLAPAAAVIAVCADGPVDLRLAQGWDSPRYGRRERMPVLTLRCGDSTRTVSTSIGLS
ncbi:heparinase II/III domain-containing protein [Elioraea sp.]|uniref:heparinase II/III domain-containing protein n=1 Tax=Elioraea sp. TaxID=2185103 RepID=UPI003F701448